METFARPEPVHEGPPPAHYGKPYVAADIVRRFGSYLCAMEDHKAAQAEAAEAKSAGRPLN